MNGMLDRLREVKGCILLVGQVERKIDGGNLG
jgi:hypothetical protein